MPNRTLHEWIESQDDGGRAFAQERLIVATTEALWARMEERGMNKAELAASLTCSKAYISQLLNGTRNMTLRTLADVAFSLACTAKIYLCDRRSDEGWQNVPDIIGGQRRPTLPREVDFCVDERRALRSASDRQAEAA
jgi:transcriptional regulator with XRE-family HTH domain